MERPSTFRRTTGHHRRLRVLAVRRRHVDDPSRPSRRFARVSPERPSRPGSRITVMAAARTTRRAPAIGAPARMPTASWQARRRAEEELVRTKEALRESQSVCGRPSPRPARGTFRWNIQSTPSSGTVTSTGFSDSNRPARHQSLDTFIAALLLTIGLPSWLDWLNPRARDDFDMEFRVVCPDGAFTGSTTKRRLVLDEQRQAAYMTGAGGGYTTRSSHRGVARERGAPAAMFNHAAVASPSRRSTAVYLDMNSKFEEIPDTRRRARALPSPRSPSRDEPKLRRPLSDACSQARYLSTCWRSGTARRTVPLSGADDCLAAQGRLRVSPCDSWRHEDITSSQTSESALAKRKDPDPQLLNERKETGVEPRPANAGAGGDRCRDRVDRRPVRRILLQHHRRAVKRTTL